MIYAARRDGASREQIVVATKTVAEVAWACDAVVLDRQEVVLGRDVSAYHDVVEQATSGPLWG